MEKLFDILSSLPGSERVAQIAYSVVVLLGGALFARIAERRLPIERLRAQHQLVVRRVVKSTIVLIALSWALNILGVNLSLLVGAAGILTVAVGFAAQTSASNLISGLFLMGEQPFVMGDVIKVGDTTGRVVSIDLLSVRLTTFDNLLVRIPNETMLKSNMTNLTHYPLRRVDLRIGIAYKEDIAAVRQVLEEIAHKNPLSLEEPKPSTLMLGYGDSSVDLQFRVWAAEENFLELRNSLYEEVKRVFDERGIEIPFPHRTIYTGSVTEPMPISIAGPSVNQETAEVDLSEIRPA